MFCFGVLIGMGFPKVVAKNADWIFVFHIVLAYCVCRPRSRPHIIFETGLGHIALDSVSEARSSASESLGLPEDRGQHVAAAPSMSNFKP